MNLALRQRIESELERADAWKQGNDPTPVLEALGYALTLDALQLRDLMSAPAAKRLRSIGRRALLAWAPTSGEDDDAGGMQAASQQIQQIAQAGIDSLGRGGAPRKQLHGLHPPSRTLARMLNGDLDGLTAGRYAAHMVGCKSCQRDIEVLRNVSVVSPDVSRFAIAAAKPPAVRPPAGGRVIADRKRPAVEAILFDDEDGRRLAVYAQANEPVRLVADGVTTEETLSGYWIGRLEGDAQQLAATLYVGDQTFEWKLSLAP